MHSAVHHNKRLNEYIVGLLQQRSCNVYNVHSDKFDKELRCIKVTPLMISGGTGRSSRSVKENVLGEREHCPFNYLALLWILISLSLALSLYVVRRRLRSQVCVSYLLLSSVFSPAFSGTIVEAFHIMFLFFRSPDHFIYSLRSKVQHAIYLQSIYPTLVFLYKYARV